MHQFRSAACVYFEYQHMHGYLQWRLGNDHKNTEHTCRDYLHMTTAGTLLLFAKASQVLQCHVSEGRTPLSSYTYMFRSSHWTVIDGDPHTACVPFSQLS